MGVFFGIPANTPVIVLTRVQEDLISATVFISEVGCTFDYRLEEASLTKLLKWLEQTISQLHYKCKLTFFSFFFALFTQARFAEHRRSFSPMPCTLHTHTHSHPGNCLVQTTV